MGNDASIGDPTAHRAIAFYQQRKRHWSAQAARANAQHRTIANLRLLVVGLFTASAVWAYGFNGPNWALAVPSIIFGYLVLRHGTIAQQQRRADRALNYFEHALSRFGSGWAGRGPNTMYAAPEHPYAVDLDLFGEGSLFDLLCTAGTDGGRHRLAQWLMFPATVTVAIQRQGAAAWLMPRATLREEMALLAADSQSSLSAETLRRWGTSAHELVNSGASVVVAAWGLSLGFLLSIGLWAFTTLGIIPLAVHAVIAWLVQRHFAAQTSAAVAGLDNAAKELSLVAGLLERVEVEISNPAAPPLIGALNSSLGGGTRHDPGAVQPSTHRASWAIKDLKRRISWLEARSNTLTAPIAFLVGWSLHWARSIDQWRAEHGPQLGVWLDALANVEALAALAHFQFDRPSYAQPLLDAGKQALFSGRDLGHPLLPATQCIANDIALNGELQVLLVSGSNMSGKSTLLRTVGINSVLALAGGVVFAAELRLSALQIGATLRIQDSLRKGRSRFYAEITRLKQVVDLSHGAVPLLFLLDELLAGTNSHDRQIGAQQLIQGLATQGAIGIVTTHDLALAKVADVMAPKARNVHFRDKLIDGELQFDYRIHDGVVQHSNALELMRSIGLKV